MNKDIHIVLKMIQDNIYTILASCLLIIFVVGTIIVVNHNSYSDQDVDIIIDGRHFGLIVLFIFLLVFLQNRKEKKHKKFNQ